MKNPMERLIQIFQEAKNPVLYLGAGISRSSPSSIPLFNELMMSYLNAIDPSEEGILKKHAGSEMESIKKSIRNLPTEAFFADIKAALEEKAFTPLVWFNDRPVNQTHKLIAKVVEKFGIKTVLTPNFDCLLEKVLVNFDQVVDMKPLFRGDLISKDSLNQTSLPDCIDTIAPSIFHLHGTIGDSVLDITPGATATPFNHFDHANLAHRLKDATILFVGCSGAYDNDVINLFYKFDLLNGIWLIHDEAANETEMIYESKFPQNWCNLFRNEVYAVKGNTTQVIAMLVKEKIKKETPVGISEFRDHLRKSLSFLEKKQRMHIIATFANQIHRGDIAMSILLELEQEIWEFNPLKSIENDLRNKTLLQMSDSVTLENGETIESIEYIKEYEKHRDACFRYFKSQWKILLGRAKSIAASRTPKSDNCINNAIVIMKDEVFSILDQVLPYEQVSEKSTMLCPSLKREWMLAYESLGIFYMENDENLQAIECFEKAKKICSFKDDFFRIENTQTLASQRLEKNPLLSPHKEKILTEILGISSNTDCIKTDITVLIEIAENLLQYREYIKCEKAYKAITLIYPDNVLACLRYASLLHIISRSQDAVEELDRGLRINSDNYKMLCDKGYIIHAMGKQREAIDILLKAIDIFPNDAYTWNNLGNCYYDLCDLKKALTSYETAIKLMPKYDDAITNRLNTLRWMRAIEKQKQNFNNYSGTFLNGTCGICKSRFRVHAEDILYNEKFYCPSCESELNNINMKEMAKVLLGKSTNNDLSKPEDKEIG